MVEQLICNQQVAGSIPIASYYTGEVPERSKGTDCKSVGVAFEGSNPSLPKCFMFEIRASYKVPSVFITSLLHNFRPIVTKNEKTEKEDNSTQAFPADEKKLCPEQFP